MTHFSQIISYQTLPLLYCERQRLSVEADWWRFFASLPSASVAHNMGRWISGPPTLYSYSSVCASSFWPHATSICSIPISDLSFPCSLCNADIRDATRKNWDCVGHTVPVFKTMVSSIKSNKAHWSWPKRITWIMCCWTAHTLQL